MAGYTIKLPGDLVAKIDNLIETEQYFTSRPEFILFSFRSTVIILVERQLRIRDMIENDKTFAMAGEMTKEICGRIGKSTLKKFDGYGGSAVTVMFRLPEGLEKLFDSYIFALGYCDSKVDFVRMSILFTLDNFTIVDKVVEDADRFISEDERRKEETMKKAIRQAITGSGTGSLLDTVLEDILKDPSDDGKDRRNR